MVKEGDKQALEYLIDKYRELVNMKVTRYFIIGAEKDDIIQEGLIGLYKAIKNYSPDKQNSFKTFANLCIERQLITAIKSSNRQKHSPLNSYLSLNTAKYQVLLKYLLTLKTILDYNTSKAHHHAVGGETKIQWAKIEIYGSLQKNTI